LIFGLAPAFQSAGISVNDALKEGSHTTGEGRGRHRLRGSLVIAETALALVLLVGAGLLANSFVRLRSVNPGFNPDGLLTFQLNLQAGTHEGTAARTVFILEPPGRAIRGCDGSPPADLLLAHDQCFGGR
jgi:putative ABC transport system permease protein